MNDFPNQVNTIQAPAVEGDFASANPRKTVLAGEGALVSGQGVIDGVIVNGIVVGRFAWTTYQTVDNDEAPGTVNTFGSGLPAGLIHRLQVGLIVPYLATASMVLLSGQQAVVFNDVDLWIKNRGATFAQIGMKAFAVFADGAASFAAAGSTPGGGSGSASSIAAATFAATGSVANDTLTITAVGSGSIYAGATVSGANVTTCKIVAQKLPLLAGEALAGIGRYQLSIPEQTAASTAISGTYGVLTVGGTVVAGFGPGQTVTGTGISVTTTIYQQLTGGAGAAGTYVVDVNTVVSSTAITSANAIETKWYARSAGAVGELIKISPTI